MASRISRTSLAILRLAVYEIKYLDSVPDSVSVNEAVELAKKYTIDESGFVNGVLGSFIRSREERRKMSLYLGIDTSNYTTSAALFNSETGEMVQQKSCFP